MRDLKSHRPSPALVVSVIALSVALGGTSYAAIVLPANSVGTKQIKKNAVTSAKVKNGSLLSADFRAGQLPAGATGATGATGLKGDKGDTGTNGTNGAAGPAGPPGVKGDPGTPAAPGTDGADGADGTAGTAGVNGAATRVRASKPAGDITVPANTITFGTAVTIPLAQNDWTQGSTETDLFLVRVTVTAPATCSGGAQGLLVNARLGGAVLLGSHGGTIPFATSETSTHSFMLGFLLDPGAATPRTVTLAANNGCSGAGQDYTVTAAAVNVAASV
jgi:hypothetical protein